MNPAPLDTGRRTSPLIKIDWDVAKRDQQLLLCLNFRSSEPLPGDSISGPAATAEVRSELRPFRRFARSLDALGDTALYLESSLLIDRYVPLDEENVRTWLRSALHVLDGWLAGGIRSTSPAPLHLELPVDPIQLNRSSFFKVTARLVVVETHISPKPGRCGIPVAPRISSDPAPRARSLLRFASRLERALGTDELDVRILAEPRGDSDDSLPLSLWAVSLPRKPLDLRPPDDGSLRLLAVRPLSTRLESRSRVRVRRFETGEGFVGEDPPEYRDFVDVSCDLWFRQLVGLIDWLDSPNLSRSIDWLSNRGRSDYFGRIQSLRADFTDALNELLVPVFAGVEDGSVKSDEPAREAFRAHLAGRLGNAFTIKAVVHARTAVEGDSAPAGSYLPELVGVVRDRASLASGGGGEAAATLLLDSGAEERSSPRLSVVVPATFDRWPEGSGDRQLPLSLRFGFDADHILELAAVGRRRGRGWWRSERSPGQLQLPAILVPRLLIQYPSLPTCVSQTGRALSSSRDGEGPAAEVVRPAGDAGLADVIAWEYVMSFQQYDRAVQDRLLLEVKFNLGDSLPASRKSPSSLRMGPSVSEGSWTGEVLNPQSTDPFEALARFAFAIPEVLADLERYLPHVGPAADKGIIRNASSALDAFLSLADEAQASLPRGSTFVADPATLRPADGTETDTVEYVVEELSRVVEQPGGPVRALLVLIHGPALPSGRGRKDIVPVVRVPGWREQRLDGVIDDGFAYIYTDPEGGEYLEEYAGRSMPIREFVLSGLDLLAAQSAISSLRIVRNQGLDPERPISNKLIYSTEPVSFANPIRPALQHGEPLDIARIGNAPGPRLLTDHLTALFTELFSTDDQSTRTVKLTCFFLPEGLAPLGPSVAVLMLPPTTVDTALRPFSDGRGMESPFDAQPTLPRLLADEIHAWLDQQGVNLKRGALRFALTVMSVLTDQPVALLELERLLLAGADIIVDQP